MDTPGHQVVARKGIPSHLAMLVSVEKRGRSRGDSETITSGDERCPSDDPLASEGAGKRLERWKPRWKVKCLLTSQDWMCLRRNDGKHCLLQKATCSQNLARARPTGRKLSVEG